MLSQASRSSVPGADPGVSRSDAAGEVRLAEVIASLSYALDLTEGQPMGHSARACMIGMRIAATLGLTAEDRSSLFYALLLKDAGCSANASKVCELYGADERVIKRDRRLLDQHRPRELAGHLLRSPAPGASLRVKAERMTALVRFGTEGSRKLTEMRCERGADVARMIDAGEGTALAIRALDEHWDGSGYPDHLAGDAIPLLGRIMCLAQSVEVFHALDGAAEACAMARSRSGTWFDPALVDALSAFESDDAFWMRVDSDSEPDRFVARLEPENAVHHADDARLDRIAEAFAQVIDAKSPFTARHSIGVAALTDGIAVQLGHAARARRDLRRAALLHDVGKLGVSNRILDKPGALAPEEWDAMRRHPGYTLRILERVAAFRPLAKIAAAHHEKLDGSGYHLGLTAEDLPQGARILTVADICEALSAERPYRAALGTDEVLAIMAGDVPHKLDPQVFAALRAHLGA